MTNSKNKNALLSVGLKLILSIFLLGIQYHTLTQGLDWSSSPILSLFSPLLIPISTINLPYILSVVMFDQLSFLSPKLGNSIRTFFYPLIALSMLSMNFFCITILHRIWRLKKGRD